MVEPLGFPQFVETRAAELQRLAWLLTGDWAAAQDLVQESLLAAWPRWEKLNRPDAPELYVRQIMVRSHVKSRRRRSSGEIPMSDLPEAPWVKTGVDLDLRETLRSALSSLPPRQRSVIALRYFCDLTEKETAEVLGCSLGAVKAHGFRAMTSLRNAGGLAELLKEGVR